MQTLRFLLIICGGFGLLISSFYLLGSFGIWGFIGGAIACLAWSGFWGSQHHYHEHKEKQDSDNRLAAKLMHNIRNGVGIKQRGRESFQLFYLKICLTTLLRASARPFPRCSTLAATPTIQYRSFKINYPATPNPSRLSRLPPQPSPWTTPLTLHLFSLY